jgi:hypothetical protein
MNLLDDSLLNAAGIKLTPEVIAQLQAAAAKDIHELLPHLQTRGEDYAAEAEKKLAARGVAESNAMREILETQRDHLRTRLKKYETFDPKEWLFNIQDLEEAEIEQLEANKRFWQQRLDELKEELKTEPERIASLYEVQATRIEPVGLVYLWPENG